LEISPKKSNFVSAVVVVLSPLSILGDVGYSGSLGEFGYLGDISRSKCLYTDHSIPRDPVSRNGREVRSEAVAEEEG
jgi:hypothetical protein